ncbi:MAG: hypothetical protein ABJM43_14630 [Paracoccaceae bacterium]
MSYARFANYEVPPKGLDQIWHKLAGQGCCDGRIEVFHRYTLTG